jgi:glyoxylase-like metal-dependent hydrolase (beta-lactamase superfamily II)
MALEGDMTARQTQGPVRVLDLHFKTPGTVGAFLVETAAGPLLVETGPESLYANLRAAVQEAGYALEDIRHVFVTHIHLDHAGAAWRLAQHGATIHVHPKGLAHLQDPGKLLSSAQRIYGDDMDRLWGRLEPIAPGRLVAMEDGQTFRLGGVALEAIHTPGHAIHHITFRLEDGLFTGDVGGVRIGTGPVIPPCPAPDIDLEAWLDSIARMRAHQPRFIYPTHFGIKADGADHLDSLEENLHRISAWVGVRLQEGLTEEATVPLFQTFMHELLSGHDLSESDIQDYENADPAFMSVYGLARYWKRRGSGNQQQGPQG